MNNSIVSLADKNSEGKVSSVHYTDFHPGYTVVLTSYAYVSMCVCMYLDFTNEL